jgi:hypothetical protein
MHLVENTFGKSGVTINMELGMVLATVVMYTNTHITPMPKEQEVYLLKKG